MHCGSCGEGYRPVFLGANFGREPHFAYVLAAAYAVLEATPFVIRLVSAAIGLLTLPGVYLLAKELFPSPNRGISSVVTFSILAIGVSYWHVNFSRLGFRAILFPLVEGVVLLLLLACFAYGTVALVSRCGLPAWSESIHVYCCAAAACGCVRCLWLSGRSEAAVDGIAMERHSHNGSSRPHYWSASGPLLLVGSRQLRPPAWSSQHPRRSRRGAVARALRERAEDVCLPSLSS